MLPGYNSDSESEKEEVIKKPFKRQFAVPKKSETTLETSVIHKTTTLKTSVVPVLKLIQKSGVTILIFRVIKREENIFSR
jgi:hypothetical protein